MHSKDYTFSIYICLHMFIKNPVPIFIQLIVMIPINNSVFADGNGRNYNC